MRIIDATQEHAAVFHVKHTSRAIAAVDDDGKAHGIAGFYFDQGAARIVMFAEMTGEMRRHPVMIVRAARAMLKRAAAYGVPIQAGVDESVPRAAEFLHFLGFRHACKGVYQWTR